MPRAIQILAEAPQLTSQSIFYWRALIELGSDRPMSMAGPGQIPLSSIRAYLDELEITDTLERDVFKRIIVNVDTHRANLIARKNREAQSRPS